MTGSAFTPLPEAARFLGGRKALVTGADSGMGQSVAYELAAHAAAVAVNYLSDSSGADRTAAEIEDAGGRAIVGQMDVSSDEDVVRATGEARDGLGGLDLLVNNAEIEKRFLLVDMPLECWRGVGEKLFAESAERERRRRRDDALSPLPIGVGGGASRA
ncbi:MAG: SDR family NAD(P)-dependent oxidoreductase [Actinomycetota bacterium]|nr:SDR family NAD(P)-dependent oxidoreductase [Actinomycetota bacterium]